MDREPDFVALTVRRLTPGAYDAWRKAWHDPEDPDALWVDQESKAYIARNVADPDEIVAFGFFARASVAGSCSSLTRNEVEWPRAGAIHLRRVS